MNLAASKYLQHTAATTLCCTVERFTSTGKEKDAESGYRYFGARYYDSELLTGWLSVDPMADKYPSISPYAYCVWNPVRLVDPDGDSCKFASLEDKAFVMNLLNKDSKVYSPEFEEKFNDLDAADHNYLFKSWSGTITEDGRFEPKGVNDNTSLILFTKGETPDTRNQSTGIGVNKIIFEEVFHAWKYERNNHHNSPTCYSEAEAWKFASLAPGNILIDKNFNLTLMGYCNISNTMGLAIDFKSGFHLVSGEPNIKPFEGYMHLPLYYDNKFMTQLGFPEIH